MKILDRYIAKNFLIGYVIAFSVLIGLRIIIELFVNLDEFTEDADLGTLAVIKNIIFFYGLRTTLYFRDFAGMITIVAAAFSFGKMVRNRELVAVMASGVSLKRVVVPVIILAIIATGALVIDQEFIIPSFTDKLVRSEDDVAGEKSYDVSFISDANGALFFSQKFDVKTATLNYPTILQREKTNRTGVWNVIGFISAEKIVYNFETHRWNLINGLRNEKKSQSVPVPVKYYQTDITPRDIPIRRKAANKALLSWWQLRTLAKQGEKIKDLAQLYAQMQSHITDPLINLVMLMVSLPILICRDPKSMKTAIMISFAATSTCYIATFICKLLATEVVFDMIIPEFWLWLPVFVFMPIAVYELDSMKT